MLRTIVYLASLILIVKLAECDNDGPTYEGYSLYRCQPQSLNQVDRLRDLMDQKRGDGIEFWTEPSEFASSVDIMASPEEQEGLTDLLRIHRIPFKTIMYDVGEVIRRTSRIALPKMEHTFRDGSNQSVTLKADFLEPRSFYSAFQSYFAMESKLNELAQSPLVEVGIAGYSYERRKMYLVKISSDPSKKKPVIFLDAGHHAREWISHSTILYIMETLVNNNMEKLMPLRMKDDDKSNEIVNLTETRQLYESLQAQLEDYDFWFIPVINPDGYEYSQSTDRLWRKTRSRNGMLSCYGIDPNRNYPFHWMEAGASSYSCSETFAGPKPLSEPETKVLADVLIENKDRIKMYLSLHAYSQLFLAPYGYARVYPDNYKELQRVAEAGIEAISSVDGTIYRFGPSAIILYPAAGGSDDFAHGAADIKLSYTIELPDTGTYGFLQPPEKIIPIGHETVVGIGAMIKAIKN